MTSPSTSSFTTRIFGLALRAVDAFSFSSGLAAAIGAGLSLCVSQILGAADAARSALLVAAGAFIIYSLDRLRDAARDADTSPLRTAFVERHRAVLSGATGIAAILFAACLAGAPPSTLALCAAIGGVGFFHRRLKSQALLKANYVSAAWTAGLIGPPLLATPGQATQAGAALGLALILFFTLLANLVASNLRDDETQLLRNDPLRALWIARLLAGLGFCVAIGWDLVYTSGERAGAGNALLPAIWIPIAELAALAGFRPSERYGHTIVDGALLLGALTTLSHLRLIH